MKLVVRFNKYTSDEQYVGSKIDLHVVNIGGHYSHHGLDLFSIVKEGVPTIVMECTDVNMNYDLDALPSNCYTIKREIFSDMCSICDSTRGFYILLLFKRFFRNVSIVGFGGKGHHEDVEHKMYHNNSAEHELIRELCVSNNIDCSLTDAFGTPEMRKVLLAPYLELKKMQTKCGNIWSGVEI